MSKADDRIAALVGFITEHSVETGSSMTVRKLAEAAGALRKPERAREPRP